MTERRNDDQMRLLIERSAAVAAERLEAKMADIIEAAAARGAELAMQKFGDMTPFDMGTKDGRDKLRETISHANLLRETCESFKSDGAVMVRRGILTFAGLTVLFGAAWLMGVDPAKVKSLIGGR